MSSSRDMVKKFHSLTPTESPMSKAIPKHKCSQMDKKLSSPSLPQSITETCRVNKSSRKPKTGCCGKRKKNIKRNNVTDTKPDANSLLLLDQSGNVSACSVSNVHIHGFGAIPVLKGDFKSLPTKAQEFIIEKARIMQTSAIYLCDGSVFEYEQMIEELLRTSATKRLVASGPNVLLTRTDPGDVGQASARVFVATEQRETTEATSAGVLSKFAKWISVSQFQSMVASRFLNCMRGRVMYVVPFSLGPIGSYNSLNGVHLSDSVYVVLHMHLLVRVSSAVWDAIGDSDFIRCIHSVGLPRPLTTKLVRNWLCNKEKSFIGHSMEKREIWSFGNGAIESSLLAKECVALRMASAIGRDEGWLAEHMAIISVTDPNGKEYFIAAAFPPGCGKTSLATMVPSVENWKIQVIGDDVAWLRFDQNDGRMYALNPENGPYSLIAGVNRRRNPNMCEMMSQDVFFTNVADTSKGRPLWQGLSEPLFEDETIVNWRGRNLDTVSNAAYKHFDQNNSRESNSISSADARFSARWKQFKAIHPLWENPKGVPLSAIIFGCSRSEGMPLVVESHSWTHGVFMAASLRTESASSNRNVEHDPMGMGSFIGYNFSNYIKHWLKMESTENKMPKMFFVNWYRRDFNSGKLLWPGFGENIRVLDWITRRLVNTSEGSQVRVCDFLETPLGYQPSEESFNLKGLNVDWSLLNSVPAEFWQKECDAIEAFFVQQMGKNTPPEMNRELEKLRRNIKDDHYRQNK